MKKYILPLLACFVSGCVTPAPYYFEQQCARQGMVLKGVDAASGSGVYVTPTGLSPALMYGQTVRCDVPKSEAESCEVSRVSGTTGPIDKYNSQIGSKVAVTTIGYFAFVLPGLLFWSSFEKEKQKAMTESLNEYQATKDNCRMPSSKSLN
jgi:hypothetical protein